MYDTDDLRLDTLADLLDTRNVQRGTRTKSGVGFRFRPPIVHVYMLKSVPSPKLSLLEQSSKMVKIALIRNSNHQIDPSSTPRVTVFVGGISGIGKLTLAKIAGIDAGFKVYVVRRKQSEESFKSFVEELQRTKSNVSIV
jgi:hypothetical protein